jgi:ribose transport system substrate-binding protein
MKKMVAIILTVILVLTLGGCAKEEPVEKAVEEAVKTPEKAIDVAEEVLELTAGKTIGFINAGPDDYYAQFGDAFKAIAAEYDIEVIEVNSDYNPEKELANVQDMIAKGVDAIAVITAAAAGSAVSISAASKAGVPIFFIAGKPELEAGTDLTGHVTDNFVMMGYMIGQWVAENYPNAKTVQIPGFLGQGPAEGELVGFDMALAEAGMEPSVILASGEWQRNITQPIVQDLVASGLEFDVIFGANEESAFGIMDVFTELGVTGKVIVSNNGKDSAWPMLIDGSLAATVPNPPSLNADLCIQQIIRHFEGKDFVQYLQIKPPFVLTGENVEQAIPWDIDDYIAGRQNNKFMWDLAEYEAAYEENKASFAEFDKAVADYLAGN